MAGAADKALEKVKKLVDSGSFYEAQQMFKTNYHRFKARKQLQDSYQILKDGAVLQLQNRQITCGMELGQLLIEAYFSDKVALQGLALQSVLDIIAALPCPLAPPSTSGAEADAAVTSTLTECSRFTTAAVKWAQRSAGPEGPAPIHDAYGQYLWRVTGWRGLWRATPHFVRGKDADAFAQALHACSREGLRGSERDLIIMRGVLQTLTVASPSSPSMQRQVAHAKRLLEAYLARTAGLDSPLVHFATMLLSALERRSLQLVRLLKQKYEVALNRDPNFMVYMAAVERIYLGVGKQAGGGLGGLLSSLLSSLEAPELDSDDEDDEGSNTEQPTAARA